LYEGIVFRELLRSPRLLERKKRNNTLNTRELRLIDEAISNILRGDYWNADTFDVEMFQNNVRVFLKDRGVRIDTNPDVPITVVFPAATAFTAKTFAYSKKYADK
jgi:hypothetical protein